LIVATVDLQRTFDSALAEAQITETGDFVFNKISAYEAFTHHLDGDFDFDRTVGIRAVELAVTVESDLELTPK